MPLHEYECGEHGRFEVLHTDLSPELPLEVRDGKLTAGHAEGAPPRIALCPKCGSCSPRLVSAFARTPGKWKVNEKG